MTFFSFFLLVIVWGSAVSLDPRCNLTKSEGTGEDRTVKYYYNTQLGICIPFFYMGDCSTGNCFSSDQDCMMSCSPKHQDFYPEGDSVCTLMMDPGTCYAAHVRFYYDNEEKMCRMFLYSGCRGNGNRFESREDCMKMCQAKSGRMGLGAEPPNPDLQTVDAGLIVGIVGGIVFAVAVIAAVAVLVIQRKAKRTEMKKVSTTEIEMS